MFRPRPRRGAYVGRSLLLSRDAEARRLGWRSRALEAPAFPKAGGGTEPERPAPTRSPPRWSQRDTARRSIPTSSPPPIPSPGRSARGQRAGPPGRRTPGGPEAAGAPDDRPAGGGMPIRRDPGDHRMDLHEAQPLPHRGPGGTEQAQAAAGRCLRRCDGRAVDQIRATAIDPASRIAFSLRPGSSASGV